MEKFSLSQLKMCSSFLIASFMSRGHRGRVGLDDMIPVVNFQFQALADTANVQESRKKQ